MIIRNMNEADIPAVQQIAKVSWHATYEGILPRAIQNRFLQLAYNDEQMKNRLQQSIMYVAELEGEIVGFANYVQNDETVELASIYLSPTFQGQGVGTALLNHAITELQGVKEIVLNVEKENRIGMNFYQAKGFQVVEEFEEDFEGHILQTVRMMLQLM